LDIPQVVELMALGKDREEALLLAAAHAFHKSTARNDDQHEAWGNLAAILGRLERWAAASRAA